MATASGQQRGDRDRYNQSEKRQRRAGGSHRLRPNVVMENQNANRAHGRGVAWHVAGLVPKSGNQSKGWEFYRTLEGDRSKVI